MMYTAAAIAAFFASAAVAAPAPIPAAAAASGYGQCGGTGWTGATTCVSGYTCTVQNAYYSQCVPGTASAATTAAAATTTAKTTVKAASTSTVKAASTSTTKVSTSVKASTTSKATSATVAATVAKVAGATTITGQWDSVATGAYTLYQDLWNEAEGTGSQSSTLDSLSGTDIAWSTSWSWSGASDQVKSYANVVTTFTSQQLSAITTIPTTWKWSYTGTSIVADVSYDMFTSSTAGGSDEYEIMVWLAAIGGAGPISSTGSAIATPTIDGVVFKLYSGPNGDTTVYSFVAETEATSFTGDLALFLAYLTANEGMSTSQYLLSIGAGTEPFTGSDAVLTVSEYSCVVN